MTTISAALVKTLRERTGAGMLECKKALVASEGDIDKAVDAMRKSGMAKADKKAGRVAAEGMVLMRLSDDGKMGAIVEVNCETDFVGRDASFTAFCDLVAGTALAQSCADVESLLASKALEGTSSIDEIRRELIAKLGENIHIRRIHLLKTAGRLGSYSHGGGRIGVLVVLTGSTDADLAKDLAMHIAAAKPEVVAPEDVSAAVREKEAAIFKVQAEASGKPPAIMEKMITNRVKKFLDGISLLGQPFVKDSAVTVGKLLAQKNAQVVEFVRYEVGEGIEKPPENFADEVMAQVRGN